MTATDAVEEWFKFWHGYLHADDDPRFLATWERALKVGRRLGYEQTKYWAGLIPLLEDLLAVEHELAVDRQLEDEHERAIAWAESNANAEEHAIRAMDGDLEELPF